MTKVNKLRAKINWNNGTKSTKKWGFIQCVMWDVRGSFTNVRQLLGGWMRANVLSIGANITWGKGSKIQFLPHVSCEWPLVKWSVPIGSFMLRM